MFESCDDTNSFDISVSCDSCGDIELCEAWDGDWNVSDNDGSCWKILWTSGKSGILGPVYS